MALLFDDLHIGQSWGEFRWKASAELCAEWREAMGEPSLAADESQPAPMPPGLLIVMYSHYMDAMVPPRPPGMMYARQKLVYGVPAREGDILTTDCKVRDKYIKRERRWVEIEATTVNQRAELVAQGLRTVIWGA